MLIDPNAFEACFMAWVKGITPLGEHEVGAMFATWRFLLGGKTVPPTSYRVYRQELGKAILLGLESLVAGDIIRTVAVAPTFENAIVLGIIVLIRTFLSMSLEVELEGRWPWQRRNEPQALEGP